MRQFDSYYEYELLLAQGTLVPFLEEMDISLDGKRVLDVGCGEGGLLKGLSERFCFQGLGIDCDPLMISKCRPARGISFKQIDFFSCDFKKCFDFILLRDVLEHCGDFPRMLKRIACVLSRKGLAYITYTPYLSPFGGHQHNGDSIFSKVPYIQFLPEFIFLRLIKPSGNFYKTSALLLEDLIRIRKTRITTGKVKTVCRQAALKVVFKRLYFIRPDYYYKFGLPTISARGFFPLMTAFDPFCTSIELLIVKQ